MSATIRTNYTAPGPANTSPWQQALASTMQDTGANAYSGNPWQDYQNPTDNAGWNYTTDPLFNASKNVNRWDLAQSGGAGTEDDRAKAYRLAFDYLKNKYQISSPGAASQQQMQEALLYGIQRVKTDLSAPENAGMGGWQSSPWYGYDKYLQGAGGTPSTSQYTPNTLGGSVDYASGGASGQGGNGGMAAPMGGGLVTGAGSASTNLPGGSSNQPTGGTYPNTSHTTGSFGQLGNFDPTYAAQAAGQDPGIAAHYLRLAAGQTGPVTTRLGQFRDSLYGKALQAVLALNGVGGGTGSAGDDMQGYLAALQSGNIGAYLNSAASRAGGANFTGVQDTDVEKILRAALALRSVNTGSLGASLGSNDLDNLLYQQEGAGLGSNGTDMTGLGSRLRSDQYGQALQQFLGASR